MAAAPPLPPDAGTREDAPPDPTPQGWVPPTPIPRAPVTVAPGSTMANLMGDPIPQDALQAQDDVSWLGQLLKTYMQRRLAEGAQMTQGPFHSAGGIDQAAGGALGAMGVVANPENRWAQFLQALAPRLYGALDRSPGMFHFGDLPVAHMTDSVSGRTYQMMPGETKYFLGFNPLSSLQDQLRAIVHEPLHGLYGVKNAGAGMRPTTPFMPAETGRWIRGGQELVPKVEQQAGVYDPAHQGIYAQVENILRSLGERK